MATMTLLEMTQEILSSMSSDEVNSIGDTTESLQVATIIKQKYRDIVSRSSLPEHEQLFQLSPSLDTTKPVLMYVPAEVNHIDWTKYFDSSTTADTSTSSHGVNTDLVPTTNSTPATPDGYKYVTMLPNQQFIDMVNTLNPSQANVSSFVFTDNSSGFPSHFTFYYRTDKTPQFCTIISNYYVIFDSFDITQDDTLQASKTMCFGQIAPIFRMEDSFVPDMDDKEFPLLLNEAKALAFYELKQMPHAKAEQEIKRQWSSVQKNKAVTNRPSYFEQLPNFGKPSAKNFSRRWWDAPNR